MSARTEIGVAGGTRWKGWMESITKNRQPLPALRAMVARAYGGDQVPDGGGGGLASWGTGGSTWPTGSARSGLVAQMAAMRLMHVGFDAHVVGEATAPAIGSGDGLLVISGSGETPVTLHQAHRAVMAGATLLAITSRPESPLARQASAVLAVQVPGSHQFGGSLFEQSALLLLDALILDLTAEDPDAHTVMRARHVNLE